MLRHALRLARPTSFQLTAGPAATRINACSLRKLLSSRVAFWQFDLTLSAGWLKDEQSYTSSSYRQRRLPLRPRTSPFPPPHPCRNVLT